MLGQGNERRRKGDPFGKFPTEARSSETKKDSLYYMLAAVVRPQSLPSAVSGSLDNILGL